MSPATSLSVCNVSSYMRKETFHDFNSGLCSIDISGLNDDMLSLGVNELKEKVTNLLGRPDENQNFLMTFCRKTSDGIRLLLSITSEVEKHEEVRSDFIDKNPKVQLLSSSIDELENLIAKSRVGSRENESVLEEKVELLKKERSNLRSKILKDLPAPFIDDEKIQKVEDFVRSFAEKNILPLFKDFNVQEEVFLVAAE